MNNQANCLSDKASPVVHASGYITLEEFVKMNNLDAFKVMTNPKYQRVVTYALALVNYTAGLDQAASRAANKNAGQS